MRAVRATPTYKKRLLDIGLAVETARQTAVQAVNTQHVKVNREIGRHIVEFEQRGSKRAEYGRELLKRLSVDLRFRYGKGFGRRNILDMCRLHLTYQKGQAVPPLFGNSQTCPCWCCALGFVRRLRQQEGPAMAICRQRFVRISVVSELGTMLLPQRHRRQKNAGMNSSW